MKPSKYNYSIANGDGNIVLYNTNSDQILVVNPQLADLWESYQSNVAELDTIHPAYYDILQKKGFILDDGKDKIRHYKKSINYFNIICILQNRIIYL